MRAYNAHVVAVLVPLVIIQITTGDCVDRKYLVVSWPATINLPKSQYRFMFDIAIIVSAHVGTSTERAVE